MAARVTPTEVKAIMDNCTVADATVSIIINAAEEVINKVFASDTTIGETLLKEIERWFAAHIIASTLDRTTSEEKVDDAQVKYTGKWGENLLSTPYGQMVMQMDVTGKMVNSSKQAARIYAVKSFE